MISLIVTTTVSSFSMYFEEAASLFTLMSTITVALTVMATFFQLKKINKKLTIYLQLFITILKTFFSLTGYLVIIALGFSISFHLAYGPRKKFYIDNSNVLTIASSLVVETLVQSTGINLNEIHENGENGEANHDSPKLCLIAIQKIFFVFFVITFLNFINALATGDSEDFARQLELLDYLEKVKRETFYENFYNKFSRSG